MGNVPDNFYEEEVRDGFFVDSTMKRCWAAQIAVLERLDEVCTKHNIQYFAEWGTLLGTVRHGGYIPWDDDLDVCMKRKDYNHFLEIAKEELTDMFVLNFHTGKGTYWDVMTRLSNRDHILVSPHIDDEYMAFPFAVGLDIFPMDFVTNDEKQQEFQKYMLHRVKGLADNLDNPEVSEKDKRIALSEIEEKLGIRIKANRPDTRERLYEVVEKLYGLADEKEADLVGLIPLWAENGGSVYPKACYEESIRMPYEYTTIPVPIGYDTILKRKYGDYMKCVRKGGSHDYPYYSQQLINIDEKGIYFPIFEYSNDLLSLINRDESKVYEPLNIRSGRYLDIIMKLYQQIWNTLTNGQFDTLQEILTNLQELAMSMGEGIESEAGEGTQTVKKLEQFCEELYQFTVILSGEEEATAQDIQNAYLAMGKTLLECSDLVKTELSHKKCVLFLPYKASLWEYFEPEWQKYKADSSYEVYVCPIPWYEKHPNGDVIKSHYEGDKFPDELQIVDYNKINITALHPETIYIQYPFDEYNYVHRTHPNLNASVLKNQTEKLIYISPYEIDEISDEDERGIKSLTKFAVMPGVAYADQTIVHCEGVRKNYIDALTRWAGEDSRGIWESKITVRKEASFEEESNKGGTSCEGFNGDVKCGALKKESTDKKNSGSSNESNEVAHNVIHKRLMIFYVSADSLMEQCDNTLSKIERVMQIFDDNKSNLDILWYQDPVIETGMKTLRPKEYDRYMKLLDKYRNSDCMILDDTITEVELIKRADAFYGDTGRVAHKMSMHKKPVMIMNKDI